VQYGEAARFTDVSQWVTLNQLLKDGIALMGEDCALKADEITRAAIIAGVTTAGQKRYAGSAADFTALSALTGTTGKVVATDFLNAVTKLKINRAPKIGGYYVGIIPFQVSRDIMNDGDWLEAAKYSDVEKLYKGELGRFHGVRFVEASNPWIEDEAEGTYDAADGDTDGLIYSTIITGADAYGVSNLAGQGPDKPEIVIVNTPDSANPLNQFITAGWKAFYVSKVLNETFMCVLRSKSTFVS
jgi:N4-gp56 family major capsid protein